MNIGIVVAMDKELQPFIENRQYTVSNVGLIKVYHTVSSNNNLFVAQLPHIGEICAAATTQMLISNYGVECIINFGVVGGLTDSASLLSTVVVSGVAHYDMDTTCIDDVEVGRYLLFDSEVIACDSRLLELARSIDNTLQVGVCASGDKFIEDVSVKSHLNSAYGAVICDMESAGILVTAKLNNVPTLMIKTVSDSLMDGAGQFIDNVYKASCQHVKLVDKLLEVIAND